MSLPSFLQGNAVVVTRTMNGWAVTANKGDPVETAAAFDTWADMVYWLAVNFQEPHESAGGIASALVTK